MDPKHFSLYGNTITPDQDRKALAWQKMFVDKFAYDPNETLRAERPRQPAARRRARDP